MVSNVAGPGKSKDLGVEPDDLDEVDKRVINLHLVHEQGVVGVR